MLYTIGMLSLMTYISDDHITLMQDTHELLRARWCEQTLSIVDVRVGDDEVNSHDPHYRFGPTRFSVIPRLAVGNIR